MRRCGILFVLLTFNLCSQTNNLSEFSLKPIIGINACQIHGDSYDGYNKLGFVGGFNVNARLSEKASLELGFLFTQKGSKHVPGKSDPSYYYLNINYIELPLYFNYYLNSKYFFTLGGYAAYFINYRENRDYIDQTGWYDYNKFDFGAVTGLGRKLVDELLVEIRFTNSLVPIRNFNSNTYYSNPIARYFNKGYYNNIVSLLLSYTIGFKKSNASS